jgi:hypothetical protein
MSAASQQMLRESLASTADQTKKEKSHDKSQIDWSGNSFTIGRIASGGNATT